jgi:hypothetical protein
MIDLAIDPLIILSGNDDEDTRVHALAVRREGSGQE